MDDNRYQWIATYTDGKQKETPGVGFRDRDAAEHFVRREKRRSGILLNVLEVSTVNNPKYLN